MLSRANLSCRHGLLQLTSRGMALRDSIILTVLTWLGFIPLLTFHEFAHAWTAWKCGDDTAYKLRRVSLNPVAHMEWIGTLILPLLTKFFSPYMIGWGKPVPVNLHNLKYPRLQDSLIAMAGPAMNLFLAWVLMGFLKLGFLLNNDLLKMMASNMAAFSLALCFFNLIPIPPLDGSHIVLHLTRMSYELYFRLVPFGFIVVLILMAKVPAVGQTLEKLIRGCLHLFARSWGLPGLQY
jgi:Zn-dependent protease